MSLSRLLAPALLASWPVVSAADPPPFPEFTFKKVGPPKAGTDKRINVQIVPMAKVPVPQTPEKGLTALPEGAFWAAVGTGRTDHGGARLIEAVGHLGDRPAIRLARLQALADRYGRSLMGASVQNDVSPALLLAVMAVESGGQIDAVSHAGAQGLMQLMPATALAEGVEDPLDADQNITGAAQFLGRLLTKFDGDAVLALAAYNAGETAVAEAGGVPAFAETRAYVPKVLDAWRTARALCLTPPDLATDPCVFGTLVVR